MSLKQNKLTLAIANPGPPSMPMAREINSFPTANIDYAVAGVLWTSNMVRAPPLPATIRSQLHSNAIAIISLVIALSSFSYTAWRMQRSEHNLTTRDAAFQMLVALGAMKQVVYHGHYDHDPVGGNPRTGWVYVETIRDFGSALPAPVPAKAEALMQSWQKHWEGIGTRDEDADAITDALDECRAAVVETVRSLH